MRIEVLCPVTVRRLIKAGEDFLTVISMRCYSPEVLGAL